MVPKAWGRGLLFILGIKLVVRGRQLINPSQPTIVMFSHESVLDIPMLFASCPVSLKFIAKKEALIFIPVIGWAAFCLGHIPINRGRLKSAIASLEKAAKKISNGREIINQ